MSGVVNRVMHTLIFVEWFLKFTQGQWGQHHWWDGFPSICVQLQGNIEAEMLIKILLCLPCVARAGAGTRQGGGMSVSSCVIAIVAVGSGAW